MAKADKDLLEKEIHKKLKEYGYDTYGEFHPKRNPLGLLKMIKLTTLAMYGEAGWTDHLWLVRSKPKPSVIFIELKRIDGVCTDIQLDKHALLRAMGFDVYVAPGLTRAKQILDQAISKALGKKWVPGRELPSP